MNTFYGAIHLKPTSQKDDHLTLWQERLMKKFPNQLKGTDVIQSDTDLVGGDLESSIKQTHSTVIFCGEIYNNTEIAAFINASPRTSSSSAALVHELILSQGMNAVSRLNGRFVICHIDHVARRAQLITDQMGIQQVFYHQTSHHLLFASEIKFLLAHPSCPAKIDWTKALQRPIPFVVMDGSKNYNAWFEAIYLLPEATTVHLDRNTGTVAIKAYWDPYSTPSTSEYKSTDEVMDAYMALLADATQIRIADAERASSFLSGGLDSSILCSLARKVKNLDTFSIITQTTLLEGTTQICHDLARDLEFQNTQYLVPYHKLTFDTELWKKRVWRAESPFTHTDSLTKTLLHHAITHLGSNPGYVLTGTGSDQLNGGLARWIVEDQTDPQESWRLMMEKIRNEELRQAIPEKYHSLWGARDFLHTDFIHTQSTYRLEENPWLFYAKGCMHMNAFTLVWDENRAASSSNRSVRYPFLDHRFPSFIAGIPKHMHAELFYDKQILRKPSAQLLPQYVIEKLKAPAQTGKYDTRHRLYPFLVSDQKGKLVEEALGHLDDYHPVINKKSLIEGIQRLTTNPDPVAWQYLLNLINLSLLEKLGEQDEASMFYEDQLTYQPQAFVSITPTVLSELNNLLEISDEAEILQQQLMFNKDCGLVVNALRNTTYLVKNDVLIYEIDEENKHWEIFLSQINNHKSTQQILDEMHIPFEEIREYFNLCLKEEILCTQPV
jgi:asparagine synthase (glutamine-hydrolysing)